MNAISTVKINNSRLFVSICLRPILTVLTVTKPVISILPKQEAMGVLMTLSKHLFPYTHILDEASGTCFQRRLPTCCIWNREVQWQACKTEHSWIKTGKTFAHTKPYTTWGQQGREVRSHLRKFLLSTPFHQTKVCSYICASKLYALLGCLTMYLYSVNYYLYLSHNS